MDLAIEILGFCGIVMLLVGIIYLSVTGYATFYDDKPDEPLGPHGCNDRSGNPPGGVP